jgi:hypothetical protein
MGCLCKMLIECVADWWDSLHADVAAVCPTGLPHGRVNVVEALKLNRRQPKADSSDGHGSAVSLP